MFHCIVKIEKNHYNILSFKFSLKIVTLIFSLADNRNSKNNCFTLKNKHFKRVLIRVIVGGQTGLT